MGRTAALSKSSAQLAFSMREFGKRLAEARERSGMTQKELADRLGTHRQVISRWEQGVSEPRLAQLHALLRLCDSSVAAVMGEDVPRKALAIDADLRRRALQLETKIQRLPVAMRPTSLDVLRELLGPQPSDNEKGD